RLPVVVQTWLDGAVLSGPPGTDADWRALIAHFRAIHGITPQSCRLALRDAVTTATSGAEGKALIADHAALLPIAARPAALQRLLERCAAWEPPIWPTPKPALCRVDPSWHNLIRRPHGWASVDWENSGWSDPAFEVANLITHPAYAAVSTERWTWVIAAYAQTTAGALHTRIATYVVLLRIWWAIRWARTLYEVPRGQDQRLVPRDAGWQAHAEAMLVQALDRAEQALAGASPHL
ncbi:MAG: phosphotransferase, partial [Blastochloris sp.]|nr:phosphotransferase [Blastochloris sp.]